MPQCKGLIEIRRFAKRFNGENVLVYKTVLKPTPLMDILEKIRTDSMGKERGKKRI